MEKYLVYLRRSIYFFLYVLDKISGRKPGVFILCYHSISNDTWRYGVSKEVFEEQINYLMRHYTAISLDDLNLYLQGKKDLKAPSFIITFDDGYQDVLAVRDFIKKLNIKPALFVFSDRKAVNRKELNTTRPFLSTGQILELKKDGWIIGCHSATHANFRDMPQEQLDREIAASKKSLEKELGFPIRYFAYPKGVYTQAVLTTLERAGYALALTMDDYTLDIRAKVLRIPRIGVNRTHTFIEFKSIFYPGAILFRKLVKNYIMHL